MPTTCCSTWVWAWPWAALAAVALPGWRFVSEELELHGGGCREGWGTRGPGSRAGCLPAHFRSMCSESRAVTAWLSAGRQRIMLSISSLLLTGLSR